MRISEEACAELAILAGGGYVADVRDHYIKDGQYLSKLCILVLDIHEKKTGQKVGAWVKGDKVYLTARELCEAEGLI